jgi:uncharacterized protein
MNLPVISNCNSCGACCMEQAGLPASWFVGLTGPLGPTASGKPLPGDLRRELKGTVKRWFAEGFPKEGDPCIWFDLENKKCRHYEYHPELCRDGVIVGDVACRAWRREKGILP